MWFTVPGFAVMGFVFWFSPASHRAGPIFGLTQGPPCGCPHLSAKLDSSVRVSGRWVGCMVSSLLFVPSQILPVRNSTFFLSDFLLQDNSGKWLSSCLAKAVVLIKGSLTLFCRIVLRRARMVPRLNKPFPAHLVIFPLEASLIDCF